MSTRYAALYIIIFILLAACRKKTDPSSITNIEADIITFSAHQGHIYNIFALDRSRTRSYNATEGNPGDPWTFRINNVDILGDNGVLAIDPNVHSSIMIGQSTTSSVNFVNITTNKHKTIQFAVGSQFFIVFDNAQQAEDIMNKSRSQQRDTLMALATEAGIENFNVSTH
jgi:hypothetical protein